MVKRAGSFRARTRYKLRKVPRTSGKVPITRLLQSFRVGDIVTINHEPAIHTGMPHPRFKNKTGVVIGKQGSAYQVKVRDGNSYKTLIATAVHLRRMQ